ncbi:MAG: hypothetical protein AAF439_09155, partial [Pseudomonadota bacterium]
MRFFLIVMCLLAMIATAWHAVFKGTGASYLHGAPQIEAIVQNGAATAAADATNAPVSVAASGRTVILSGYVHSQADRDALLAAVSQTRLATQVIDETALVAIADPFVLKAEKLADGTLSLSGNVPGAEVENEILAQARTLGAGANVRADLEIAGGVPDGDWVGFVTAGLAGLSHLSSGTLILQGRTGHLQGEAPDMAARNDALAAIVAAPMGPWSQNITGAPPPGGFRFSAVKMPDGGLVIEGHAPDAPTRDSIIATVDAASDQKTVGTLDIATGMPDPGWPDQVRSAVTVLGRATTGVLTVEGGVVSLSAEVETDEDMATLTSLADPS